MQRICKHCQQSFDIGGLANRGKPKSEEHKQKLRETWVRKKLERTSSQAVKAPTS